MISILVKSYVTQLTEKGKSTQDSHLNLSSPLFLLHTSRSSPIYNGNESLLSPPLLTIVFIAVGFFPAWFSPKCRIACAIIYIRCSTHQTKNQQRLPARSNEEPTPIAIAFCIIFSGYD
jgi:hypothetical protein